MNQPCWRECNSEADCFSQEGERNGRIQEKTYGLVAGSSIVPCDSRPAWGRHVCGFRVCALIGYLHERKSIPPLSKNAHLTEVGPSKNQGKGFVVMSLQAIEEEEDGRIQYELQLSGQGGKRCKVWPLNQECEEKPKGGTARVESSGDYILTLEEVTR